MEHLHHHIFSNMLFDMIFETHCAWSLSWALGKRWAYNSTNLPNLSIIFPNLFHSTSNTTWIATSFNCKYFFMRVHTSHQCYKCPPSMLHLWQWTHEYSWCGLRHVCCHCMKCRLPCGMKIMTCASFNHIPLLLSTSWHGFTKNGIHTLSDVVIVAPTQVNLFCQSYTSQGFLAFKIAQAK
jgi:hypothetical protein